MARFVPTRLGRLLAGGLVVTVITSTASSLSPAAAADDFILMPRAEFMALPASGAAWDAVVSWAGRSADSPDLSDQDDTDNVIVLAKALVAARTGDAALRDAVVSALRRIPETENGGRTLALARELGAYVLAADLIGYHDAAFVAWLRAVRTESLEGRTLISTHEDRPNNWGTHAGATRVIVARYLGDTADLARAAAVFKGYLGDRATYAGFDYGDLSWQANASAPVGINPKGATKNGTVVDGILPDDMRRGGTFPTVGADGVKYTWEGLQGVLLQAEMLTRAGYPAFTWQDEAIRRAIARIYALGYPAAGDDMFQPWLVNFRYGTSYPASTAGVGKAFGFTDWLYGGRTSSSAATSTPTATSSPTPTPTPTPVPTPSPTATPTATPSFTATPTPAPVATPTPTPPPTAAPTATPTATASPPATPVATSVTLTATADAEVTSKDPASNYGAARTIGVRGHSRDIHVSYLTFAIPALDGPIASVRLRLYVTDGSRDAGSVHRVASGFDEHGITYVSAPDCGVNIGTIGQVAKNRWIEVPLSAPIAGGQIVWIALQGTNADTTIFGSRESSTPPTLVITLGS